MTRALELLNDTIAELEARLNLKPDESVKGGGATTTPNNKKKQQPKKEKKAKSPVAPAASVDNDQLPDICKLEFKVGVITKVWVHEKADKLYCEEIDVGEEAPRQIASGLRPHFDEDQMLGQRLLVVSNLKAKNLVGFKSHGMVLCAAEPTSDGGEKVEFVEPPAGAAIGEIVTFEGLPPPQPMSSNQCDKKKIFQVCTEGMKTTDDCKAVWNGHPFMTTAGPCTTKTIAGGVMR
jgi:aminoacyl tRNA synthase complex-interacting multifunctional protein 1